MSATNPTVLDLITSALRSIQALGSGETPTASEAQDALLALNELIDSWGAERLTMPTSSRALYPLTAGLGAYSIGPSVTAPNWIAPRPEYIDRAGLVLAADPYQSEIPLRLWRTDAEWARVKAKALSSTIPTGLYYQPDFPAGTVFLWPIPTATNYLALYTPTALSGFTSLTQALVLPPAYWRALRTNLALNVASQFGAPLTPELVAAADESKSSLKRANTKVNKLRTDVTYIGHSGGGRFNYITGEQQ